jgi:hypothetical protein
MRKEIWYRIRYMLRTRKLALYLKAYNDVQNADPVVKNRILNYKEISDAVDFDKFIRFVGEQEKRQTPESLHKIEVEIKDRIPEFFLNGTKGLHTETNARGIAEAVQDNYLGLSSKGRKLVEGSWFSKQLYFVEFLGKEHWLLYTICASIISLMVGYFVR